MCKDEEAKLRNAEARSKRDQDQKLIMNEHECRGSGIWQARPAATDEVNDFQFVTVLKRGRLPLGAGNDFKVQLHGNPVRLHAELRDQCSHSQAVRKFALFAIDVKEHKQIANSNWQLAKPFYRRGRKGRNGKEIPTQLFQILRVCDWFLKLSVDCE